MHRRDWIALVVLAAAAVAVVPAKRYFDGRSFDRGIGEDLAALNQDAIDKARKLEPGRDADEFQLWYIDQTLAIIERRRAQAPPSRLAVADATAAVFTDLRKLLADANVIRQNRRELGETEPWEYHDPAVAAAAIGKIKANIEYIRGRKALFEKKREEHRSMLAQSGLEQKYRVQMWQMLQFMYDGLVRSTRNDDTATESYEALLRMVEFLDKHRGQYEVDKDGRLMFRDALLLMRFKDVVWQVEHGRHFTLF